MSQSSAPVALTTESPSLLPKPNLPLASQSTSTPPMSIVAARKAALLQKFGVREVFQTQDPPITPTSTQEWSWRTRPKELETPRLTPPHRERRDTFDSMPLAKTLIAAPTGSTLASTVVDINMDDSFSFRSSRSGTPFGSASRVRMAIAAFSQKEDPSGFKVADEYGSGVQRSWSRLSEATRFQEEWNSPPRKLSLASETSSTARFIRSLSIDDSFDTHPPDMKSPRTRLAHVIEPPKPPKAPSMSLPGRLKLKEKDEVEKQQIAEPKVVVMLRPVAEHTALPSPSPIEVNDLSSPTATEQAPALVEKEINTPKWVRGAARKTDHIRTPSFSSAYRASPRPRKPTRAPSSSISISRPRLSSTISYSISHSTPLTVKAQNPIPLRKTPLSGTETRPPLKPFRTSLNL